MANEIAQLTGSEWLAQSVPNRWEYLNSAIQLGTTMGGPTLQLPSAGLIHRLWVIVQGTLTFTPTTGTGTVTSGTWANAPFPAPFGMISGLRVSSNNGVNIVNTTGFGAYLMARSRHGLCTLQNTLQRYCSEAAYTLGQYKGVDGSFGTYQGMYGGNTVTPSGTITFTAGSPARWSTNFAIPIDFTYNRQGDTGWLNAQDPSVKFNVDLSFADILQNIGPTGLTGANPIFGALVGTNISPSFSGSVKLVVDRRFVPEGLNPAALARLTGFYTQYLSTQCALTPNENRITVPRTEILTGAITQCFNNGAPLTRSELQRFQLSFGGNAATPIDTSYIAQAASTFWEKMGALPVDGCFDIDLGTGRGNLLERDTFNAIDNKALSDVEATVTVSPDLVPTGTRGIYLHTTALRRVVQG